MTDELDQLLNSLNNRLASAQTSDSAVPRGKCTKCKKDIAGTVVTAFEKQDFHPECFCCSSCNSVLDIQGFYTHEQKLFCTNCYESNFLPKCAHCNKPIVGVELP